MAERFADHAVDPESDPTLSVAELAALVRDALATQFPGEVWVRGEVQRCSRSAAGHLYFNLVEQRGGTAAATMKAACFAGAYRSIQRTLAEVPGLELADDVEVRVRGRIDYYGPSGALQLIVTGIDPYFTAGKIAVRRAQVLAALRSEGLLERNRKHVFPLAPLHIGLVTSIDSAAYNDFVHELESSDLGLRVSVADARVQGQEAPRSIVMAMRACVLAQPDVIVVVRGGGAKHDLAAFDHEAVARAIALAPVPVLVGVGHQIDSSVADEVAYRSFKTPTACAQALVAHITESHGRALRAWERIVDAATGVLERDGEFVEDAAERVVARTRAQLRHAAARIDEIGRGVRRDALRAASRADERVLRAQTRVIERVRRRHDIERVALDHRAERLRLLDPANVLRRGYSITFDAEGRAVRRADALAPGAIVTTLVAEGTIRSTVTETEEQ